MSLIRLMAAGGSSGGLVPSTLPDRLVAGTASGNLGSFSTGINEFDLLYAGGVYYWAFDDKTQSVLRHASAVSGLNGASNDQTVAARYPTIQLVGSTWHLWGWNAGATRSKHYTASSFGGTYTFSDDLPSTFADVAVRQSPYTGTWYAGYKSTSTLYIGVMSAASPAGPWTDLGYVFADTGHPTYASDEEADPNLTFYGGRTYVTFSAYNGVNQQLAIVEVTEATMRAVDLGEVFRAPSLSWEGAKIFNPVYLSVDDRCYYSRNNDGASAGWGYITPGA